MPIAKFRDLMVEADKGKYAVGYFESWSLESFMAIADAAEAMRSPILLGFSGIYLPHPGRVAKEPLSVYAALGIEGCKRLSVPACLVFNESPHFDVVLEAIDLGFGLVMFTDEKLSPQNQLERVSQVVQKAHQSSVAVEGELTALPGVGGQLWDAPNDLRLTSPQMARNFVECTGIDALAVNIGQAHLHGRNQVHLNLSRLAELKEAVSIPLVLHGASSICPADLSEAVRQGIRKINVGSILKRSYFEALRGACAKVGDDYNPYEVVGSGLSPDVLVVARSALQKVVENLILLFGSARKA